MQIRLISISMEICQNVPIPMRDISKKKQWRTRLAYPRVLLFTRFLGDSSGLRLSISTRESSLSLSLSLSLSFCLSLFRNPLESIAFLARVVWISRGILYARKRKPRLVKLAEREERKSAKGPPKETTFQAFLGNSRKKPRSQPPLLSPVHGVGTGVYLFVP